MVHGVREMLCFQTDAVVRGVHRAVFALSLRQKSGGVYLQSRQRGVHRHFDAAFAAVQHRRRTAVIQARTLEWVAISFSNA